MKRKVLAILVIFFIFGTSIVISNDNVLDVKSCLTTLDYGNLYGYVNDTNSDPIESALVRVYFHGEYEEDYTDEFGYYHVANIPLCWCMKNTTASKEAYISEEVLLVISEHTYYDFILEQIGLIPDLECEGSIDWVDIEPGGTVTASFNVENIGEDGSQLDWEIISWPEWGTWTFDPEHGFDLLAGDSVTVDIETVAPNEPLSEYDGEVKIINSNNPEDYCIIQLSLAISYNDQKNNLGNIYHLNFLKKMDYNIPYIYQILINLIIIQKSNLRNKDNLLEDQNIIAREGVNGYVK